MYFEGIIDEVFIFHKALNSDEIADLYSNYGYTTPNYPGAVLVRRYIDPEPTHGDWGNEEETGFPGWIVNVIVANTGEIDTTITDIIINGKSFSSYGQIVSIINRDTGEVYYNATVNKFEEGITIKTDGTIVFQINVIRELPFKHGSNIEIKIKTASGQEYPKTIQLP